MTNDLGEMFWKSHYTEEDMKKYIVWNAIKDEDFNKNTAKECERIIQSLGFYNTEDKLVVDFGCGIGRLTRFLGANTNNMLLGIDVDSIRVNKAKEYITQPFDIKTGINNKGNKVEYKWIPQFAAMQNGYTLPVADEQVDFVFSHIVLQHIHKYKVYFILKEFFRMLKKGGKGFIQLPNFEKCMKQYDMYATDFIKLESSPWSAMNFWFKEEAKIILEKVGFEIDAVAEEGTDLYITFKKP